MHTVAKAGGWTVLVDANSVVSIQHDGMKGICIYDSAYEAIKGEVKDPTIRTELLRQWAASR